MLLLAEYKTIPALSTTEKSHPTGYYATTEFAKMEATFVHATGVLVLAPTKRIVRRAYIHSVGIDTNRVSMSDLTIRTRRESLLTRRGFVGS